MLRYSTKQTWRNWQLFLPIFLCVVVATSIFTSTSLAANVMQIVLTEDVVNGVAVDMTYASFLPPDQLFQLRQDIEAIDEIKSTELIIRHTNVTFGGSEGIITTAIQSNSSIYEGIRPLFGTTELGVNETLIASTSLRINEFPVGSNYTLRFAIEFANGSTQWVYLSLTVVGQISIIPSALNAIAGLYAVDGWYPPGDEWRLNKASYLIVDLDETFLPLLQYSLSFNDSETTYLGRILHINLDHSSVIDPLDIAGSAQKVDFLGSQIKQILDYALENHLATALTLFYQRMELNRVMVFQISTITILLTIYVAFTLSEVTLTVKKQEIGLLLLKGGTRQKIQNSSLLQALLLGVFGSLVGLTCTLMVSPFLLNSFLYFGLTLALLGKDTIL